TPHPLYRPSNDLVACRHPLCVSLHQNDNYDCESPHQCDYEVEYADHYSSLGVLVNDVYVLNFTNGVQLKIGYDQIFPDSSYNPVDGMLGLGRGRSSLISQLNSQGLVRNVVGHCLGAQGGGKHYSAGAAELIFGGKRTGIGNLHAIFDTGSSYTYFNSHAYQALISWLKKELAGKPLKEAPDDQTVPLCWHAQFEIPPEAYLIISNMGNVCLGILDGSEVGVGDINLIGDISMLDKVMVFDNEKQLIGWAPADCNRVPKSRDVSI
ncbi:Xylanase inhibitor, C-terminal, partial [Sesbania bispinosa]